MNTTPATTKWQRQQRPVGSVRVQQNKNYFTHLYKPESTETHAVSPVKCLLIGKKKKKGREEESRRGRERMKMSQQRS